MSQSNTQSQGRALGYKGYTYTADTGAVVGNYFAIHAINGDAVLASGTEANGSTMSSVTIDQGDTLYGVFTGYTLTSGKVIAYKS